MRRRHFLACAAALIPLGAAAQAPKRIGILHFHGGLMSRQQAHGMAFIAAMRELGYREGVDYLFDERSWQRQDELPDMVRDLVRLNADLIIAAAPPSIVAAKKGTAKIPIVFMYSAEPVAMGLVESLSRPGGNMTGLTWDHGFETSLKTLELVKEALPNLGRVAVMWDGTDSVHPVYARYFAKAAPLVGLRLLSLELKQAADLEPAFVRIREERGEALIVLPSGQITIPNRLTIMKLASRDRVPTLINTVDGRDYPDALLKYGPNLSSQPRGAAAYVHRIFKGAKPGEIPIEQPDKYDLVVDLAAARKLGIAIPPSILVRADRVIQ